MNILKSIAIMKGESVMERRSSSFKVNGPFAGRRVEKGHVMRGTLFVVLVILLSLGAAGCQTDSREYLESDLSYKALQDKVVEENNMMAQARERERQLEVITPDVEEVIEPVMPEFNPLDETTISISVQEETIHNILYIIARNAGLNLIIEPGISLENRATITFENAVSTLVVERLLAAYDLAWEVEDNVLYVHRWNEQVFDLDFINVFTEVTSASGGDIFGSALATTGGGGGGGGSLSGAFSLSSQQGGDFDEDSLYGFILRSVQSIIEEEDQFGDSGGESDSGGEDSETQGYFAIDPVSGRLYVRTTPGKLKAVAKLLNNLKAKLSRQVVIDARLLEVQLRDGFQLGVDWNYVNNALIGGELKTFTWGGRGDIEPTEALFRFDGTFGNDTLQALVDALQTFGGVKALANPHVRTKHGQPALFTSGTSDRFVSGLTRETDDDGNVLFTTETATVFSGVLLGVAAYINDADVVDLQIFPIQSSASNLQLQQITAEGDQISLPRVEVKSVSTTIRVKDGDTIILGGMISKDVDKTDSQVPGLGNVPGLGWLFKNRNVNDEVKELVIVMTIRVVQ